MSSERRVFNKKKKTLTKMGFESTVQAEVADELIDWLPISTHSIELIILGKAQKKVK